MKVTIEGTTQEIAALVIGIQSQQRKDTKLEISIDRHFANLIRKVVAAENTMQGVDLIKVASAIAKNLQSRVLAADEQQQTS